MQLPRMDWSFNDGIKVDSANRNNHKSDKRQWKQGTPNKTCSILENVSCKILGITCKYFEEDHKNKWRWGFVQNIVKRGKFHDDDVQNNPCCKNNIFNGSDVTSKILGLGYKEDIEEDHQIIQILLKNSKVKSNKIRKTPYPSIKDGNQDRESASGLYPKIPSMDTSRSTAKLNDKDILQQKSPLDTQV